MAPALKLFALGLVTALLALVINKQAPELALALTLCACATGIGLILSWVEPILELAKTLAHRAELDPELTGPLLRCLGLALLTEISAAVCADAGQSALAKLVELGGGVLCLAVSLPLLRAMLALVEALL